MFYKCPIIFRQSQSCIMSDVVEIPAFSIWEMLHETVPALSNNKLSEKSAEQLAKIIKSRDFSNIFVYSKDPLTSFEKYQQVEDRYKSFTTWFLGRFFYLLSCNQLSKSHQIYLDIQLFVLDQLSDTSLDIYEKVVEEYYQALDILTKFIKTEDEKLSMAVFIPVNYPDLCTRLNLEPIPIQLNKANTEQFLISFLKIIKYITNQKIDFHCYDVATNKTVDNLLFLLSECSFAIKLEISQIYLEIAVNLDGKSNVETIILHKLNLFIHYIEHIIYSVYIKKIVPTSKQVHQFEAFLLRFLEINVEHDCFLQISEFLLTKQLELTPSNFITTFCYKKRKVPLYSPEDFENYIQTNLKNHDFSVLCGLKQYLIEDLEKFRANKEGAQEFKIYCFQEGQWRRFYFTLIKILDSTDCTDRCIIQKVLEFLIQLMAVFIEMIIETKNSIRIIFVEEDIFIVRILSILNKHFFKCEENIGFNLIYNFFVSFTLVASTLHPFIDIFTSLFGNSDCRGTDHGRYKKEISDFCKFLVRFQGDKNLAFDYFNKFLRVLSSGFYLHRVNDLEALYIRITKQMDKTQALTTLPYILTLFDNSDLMISDILIPALSSTDESVLTEVLKILPKIICISTSDFTKTSYIEDNELQVEIFCNKCDSNNERNILDSTFSMSFSKIDIDLTALSGTMLKYVLKSLTLQNPQIKLDALEVLPFISNHILKFYSGHVAKIWVEKAGDQDDLVRRRFGHIAAKIIHHAQENKVLAANIKEEIVDVLFNCLMKFTKKSLQDTDVNLQETILDTIEEISKVNCEKTIIPTTKILIYLIMVPTSRHSLIAVNRFFSFTKHHSLTPTQLYKNYKREICGLISHLCIVSQTLIDQSLATSLNKISVTLEFYSSKDFISRECHQLLPFFVARVIKTPSVEKLMNEMALMVNMTLAELLTNIYGNIFLHSFLHEPKEDFKQCLMYLENTTGLSSSSLRKKNLWVILNELLLNFHEKREKVLTALDYLARNENEQTDVREYLQGKLLGLLQHFDFKLMGKNTQSKASILLSLADFFKYMGSTYIGPLRFKIIAMLRTVDCGSSPEVCQVWDAFVKSCDVDSLAPQLATIFVSVLPLIKSYPKEINEIFKYLIIRNENQTKDFIKDLFFVDDLNVDPLVLQTIKKHLKPYQDSSLRDKMNTLLKYLSHETSEVRIRSLKQLKILMEKNREELDRMILGYNGIDPIIVDLIENLTLGCREKDLNLKLACGEVIGELGAVEPSHLPRKYAQNSRSFAFFMNDDSFIVNSLNELAKALQGEKNTVNMDRFAVAIQEILKHYGISADGTSTRKDLWLQFPESQQALMLPLLTSRYIVSQPQEITFPVPIYGSSEGTTFQKWLYNWTRSLIVTLPQEYQSVLHPCLPAMKQDHRILMQFLPHILLHSIISDSSDIKEKLFIEIKTVITSFENKKQTPNVRGEAKAAIPLTDQKLERIQCTKTVFLVLDFLERWTREWQWKNGSHSRSDHNFIKVMNFLGRFCKLELAKCNFHSGEYPRALLYLEDYITNNSHQTSSQLTFLTKIYAQLDEPDGVAGVTAVQPTEPPIEQRILSLEVSGKLSDAAACYERLPQPLKLHHLKGLIQCYLDLDNVNTALNFAQGALDRQIEFGNTLLEMQAEPLWRLGRYEDLDSLLKREELEKNTSWGVQIGRALLSFQNQDRLRFESIIQDLKSQQTDFLGAASVEEGAYQQGYEYISRLHALNELQQVEKATWEILNKRHDTLQVVKIIKNLAKEWELRIKVVQESVRIVEPLLCLRRVGIEQAKRILERTVADAVPPLNSLLGELWLLSAKTARNVGVHQQSYTYTLKAEEFAPPSLFVEKSQLYWLREEHEQALITLKRGLEELLSDNSKETLSLEKRKICAEAKLFIATYNDKVSNVDTDIKTANYKEAIEMYKEWETGLVKIAQFYDRRLQCYSEEERDNIGSDIQIWMINYFCKSLRYGTKFVYQSMPRILSIWFDYGKRLLDVTDANVREERRNKLIKMTKLIDDALETLPAYVFLTAFSQIISRICHPQREVYKQIKAIVLKLLQHYPQQCLWMLISVIKSSYAVRAKRCSEILSELKTADMTKLVKDFTSLAEKLIELCNKEVPSDVEMTTVSALLRSLPRLLNKADFSEIMIPTHKFRKLVLPNPDFSSGEHNPFPNYYVRIVGIEEEVTLLRSLQRPRKITLRGSDGKRYIQMLKPNDDLRKDFRLMEFNDIVNQLLSREPESRQRRLHIRLYSVSPLNEECGLIEWIPNLIGLRPVLQSIYRQKGKGMTMKEIKDASCNIRDPLSKKRDVFTKVFLARHPPVLGEWFRRTFPDAQSWFFARTAYIRTTAVISMVGYILGLGDRHGENILLDSICGDTVHVDFNCVFNKGESFEWPERVPFRLTQNMVAAMGPLGVEGVFRKSCACALKVLRTNKETLESIVTPFVYDPLVSWSKHGPTSIHSTAERTNEQAFKHVNDIKLRLEGKIVKSRDRSFSIPLSVDGQTNSLINEAMNIDNLCQMYIGWGPYL